MTITTFQAPVNYQLTPQPPQFADIPTDVEAYIQQLHNSVLITQRLLTAIAGALPVVFSETVVYGAMVDLYNNAGVPTARNANSSNTGSSGAVQPVCCFCNSPNGIVSGQTGFVQFSGVVQGLSGLTAGSAYYLAAANGTISTTRDTTAGHIEQYVGTAISTSSLVFAAGSFIQH